jgi:hypothetical protein
VFDLVGNKLDIDALATSHTFDGYSFTYGNSGFHWLFEALDTLSSGALGNGCQ